MSKQNFVRVMRELTKRTGFKTPDGAERGSVKLQVGPNAVSFIHEESADTQDIGVFVDLGAADYLTDADVLRKMLQLNFGFGGRGALSLHPITKSVFYTFRHPLGDSTTGQQMFDALANSFADAAETVVPAAA